MKGTNGNREARPVKLIVLSRIFDTDEHEEFDLPICETLAASFARLAGVDCLPEQLHAEMSVFVGDGVELAPAEWPSYTPAPGAVIVVRVRPAGPLIVPAIASLLMSAGGATAATLGASLVTMSASGLSIAGLSGLGTVLSGAISIGLSLAVSALFKPSAAVEQVNWPNGHVLNNQSNKATPYQPVPRVYGRMKMAPRLVAVPRTVMRGGYQHFQAVYSCGYGPLAVRNVRAGDTPVSSLQGATVLVHDSFKAGDPLSIYTQDTTVTGTGITMIREGNPGYQVFRARTPPGSRVVDLNFIMPAGLYNVNATSGGKRLYHTRLVFTARNVTAGGGDDPNNVANYSVTTGAGMWGVSKVFQGNHFVEFVAVFDKQMANTLHFTMPVEAEWEFAVWQTFSPFTMPGNGQDFDTIVWQDITTYHGRAPINPEKPETIIEIEIPAQEQAKQTLQLLTCEVASWLPTFDAAGTPGTWVETSNPAWIYADMLRGSAASRPLPHDRIDWPAIVAWAAKCDAAAPNAPAPSQTCDVIIENQTTLWEALHIPLGCGRAAYALRNSKHSVITDDAVRVPVQLFTELNSHGFSAARQYMDPPHALRVLFFDPDSNWEQREVVCYAPGYDANTATRFESLNTVGVIRPSQAWRDGMYFLAQAMLRRETVTLKVDAENLACQRGDLVLVAHDTLTVGGQPAYVAAVINPNEVQVGGEFGNPAGGPFAMRVRGPTAVGGLIDIVSVVGDRIVTAGPHGAMPGDLLVWGEKARTVGEYLVKEITAEADLAATLTLVEYAPAVLSADTGFIPPYVPEIGGRPTAQAFGPLAGLSAVVSHYLDGSRPMGQAVATWAALPGAVRYEVWAAGPDGVTLLPVDSTTETRFELMPRPLVLGQERQAIKVIAINGVGARTEATATALYDSDNVARPPAPAGVSATPRMRDVLVRWTRADAATDYLVRFPGEPDAVVRANEWFLPVQPADITHTIEVFARDALGRLSAAATATFTVQRPRAPLISGNAHSNIAYLRWGSLAATDSWSAETTHALDYFEISAEPRAAPPGPGPGPAPAPPLPPVAPDGWEAHPFAFDKSAKKVLGWHPHPEVALPSRLRRKLPPGPPPAPPPAPVLLSMPGELVGRYKGEFLRHEEARPGLWRFYVRAVDIAGNASDPINFVDLRLKASDSLVIVDKLDNVLGQPGMVSPLTNAVDMGAATGILVPVCVPGQTWEEHFQSRAWAAPQDQIDAGFQMYAQPACDAQGVVAWEHDFGKALGAVQLTVSTLTDALGTAGATEEVHILYRDAPGNPWTDPGAGKSVMLPDGTQFVRIEARFTSPPPHVALSLLQKMGFVLSVELSIDGGSLDVPASGLAAVTFTEPFTDVRSVLLTVETGSAARYADYALNAQNTGMTVAVFDATGNPTAGRVSWIARGVRAV